MTAACAIIFLTKLYANICAHISLRTISGVFPLKISMRMTSFTDRRLSSTNQRHSYSSPKSWCDTSIVLMSKSGANKAGRLSQSIKRVEYLI